MPIINLWVENGHLMKKIEKKYPKDKIPPKINQYNDEEFLRVQE